LHLVILIKYTSSRNERNKYVFGFSQASGNSTTHKPNSSRVPYSNNLVTIATTKDEREEDVHAQRQESDTTINHLVVDLVHLNAVIVGQEGQPLVLTGQEGIAVDNELRETENHAEKETMRKELTEKRNLKTML